MRDASRDIFEHSCKGIHAMQNGTHLRSKVVRVAGQGYGCDPVGDGTLKVVPNSDIVDAAEHQRRLRL